jgi:YggT family protein
MWVIFIIGVLTVLIQVAWWIILVQFVLSILIAFNVINTYNEVVGAIWNMLRTITEPIYRPIRRILPDFGAIDLSPMVVIIILMIIERALIPQLVYMSMGSPV